MARQEWSLFFCLVLTLNNPLLVLGSCDDNGSLYLIRSTASSLVVDAGDGRLTLQYFDGYTPQLWKFKMGNKPGLFYIINGGTGKVLDVDRSNGNRVILRHKSDSLDQQWYLHSNGRIFNAGLLKNLDVQGARYVPNNPVIVYQENGNAAQDFIIKEKITCCPSTCTNVSSLSNPTSQK